MTEKGKKVMITLKSLGMKVKENIVPILFWTGTGVVLNGSVKALKDHKRLNRLEKDHAELVQVFNGNVDKHNNFMNWANEEIDKLTRQNNELLERALRETEGKP